MYVYIRRAVNEWMVNKSELSRILFELCVGLTVVE